MRAEIERVDVTLMIALSGNTHATRLEEVVTAVRNMANTVIFYFVIRRKYTSCSMSHYQLIMKFFSKEVGIIIFRRVSPM